jgi:acylphosphatase
LDSAIRAFRIHGKVQGVFFRHSTRIEAERLDLSGFARNLEDGTVEVCVRGSAESLEELSRWLKRGPARARVDAVEELNAAAFAGQLPSGFEVR